MTLLVSQDEALRQLRLSSASISPDELTDVMFKAEQASDIVVDYLKAPGAANYVPDPQPTPTTQDGDWWGGGWGWLDWGLGGPPPSDPPPLRVPQTAWIDTTCPPMIKGVVLIILTALYDGRTPGDDLLSDQLCAVLARYRDPALA
jgi:hypothetical protein